MDRIDQTLDISLSRPHCDVTQETGTLCPSSGPASDYAHTTSVEREDQLNAFLDIESAQANNNSLQENITKLTRVQCQTITSEDAARTSEDDPLFISPKLESAIAKAERSLADRDLSDAEQEDIPAESQRKSSDSHSNRNSRERTPNLQSESPGITSPDKAKNAFPATSQSLCQTLSNKSADITNIKIANNSIETSSQVLSHTASNDLPLSKTAASAESTSPLPHTSSESAVDDRQHSVIGLLSEPAEDTPNIAKNSTNLSPHSLSHNTSNQLLLSKRPPSTEDPATSTAMTCQNTIHDASDVTGIKLRSDILLVKYSKEDGDISSSQPHYKRLLPSEVSSATRNVRSRVESSDTLIPSKELAPEYKALYSSSALPVYSKLLSALEEARSSDCLTASMTTDLEQLTSKCKNTGHAIIHKVPLPPSEKVWIIIDEDEDDLSTKYKHFHPTGDSFIPRGQFSSTPIKSQHVPSVDIANNVLDKWELIQSTNENVVEQQQIEDVGDTRRIPAAASISPEIPPQPIREENQEQRGNVEGKQRLLTASEISTQLFHEEQERHEQTPNSCEQVDQSNTIGVQSTESQVANEKQISTSHQQTQKSPSLSSDLTDTEPPDLGIQSSAGRIEAADDAPATRNLRKRKTKTVEGVLPDAADTDTVSGSLSVEVSTIDPRDARTVAMEGRVRDTVTTKKRKVAEVLESPAVFVFFIGSAQIEKELTDLMKPYHSNQTSKMAKLAAWDALTSLLQRRRVGEPLDQVFPDCIEGGINNVVVRTKFDKQNWFEAINKKMPQLFNSHKGEPAYAHGFFNTLYVKTESLTDKVPQNVPAVWHQTWRTMRMSLCPSPGRVSVFLKILLDSVVLTGKTFFKDPPASDSEKAMTGVQAVCQAITWVNSQKALKPANSKNLRLLDSNNAESLIDLGLIQQWHDIFIRVVDSYIVQYFEVNYILKDDASSEDKAVAMRFKKQWKGDSVKSPTLSYLTMFACCGIRGLICCSGDVNVAPAGQMLSFAVLSEWLCKQRPDFKVTEPIFKRSNQMLMRVLDGLFDEEGHFVKPEITWYELAKNLCFDYLSRWFAEGGQLAEGRYLVFPKSSVFSGKDHTITFPGGA